jgi:antitoxin HicB
VVVHDCIVQIERVPEAEGGGLFGRVPDLPGCMSDGEDLGALETNITDAIATWIAAAHRLGRTVPPPTRNAFARRA